MYFKLIVDKYFKEGDMKPFYQSCIHILVQRQIPYKMAYISLTYTIEENEKKKLGRGFLDYGALLCLFFVRPPKLNPHNF